MKPSRRYLPALLVALLPFVSTATADCSCDDTVCLYEEMKTELYTTSVADNLQLAFFTTIPFFDSVRISTTVNFTLTDTSLNTSTTSTASWMHQWYPYTSYGVLQKLFPAVFRGSMDPWTALPVFYQLYSNQYFTPVSLSINLTCYTNSSATTSTADGALLGDASNETLTGAAGSYNTDSLNVPARTDAGTIIVPTGTLAATIIPGSTGAGTVIVPTGTNHPVGKRQAPGVSPTAVVVTAAHPASHTDVPHVTGTPGASKVAAGMGTRSAIVMTLNQLWAKSLQWAKAYARYNGPAPYPSDYDRGIAYDVMSFTSTDLVAFALFCTLYVLFNIVVAVVVIAASSPALKWLSTQSQKKPYIFSLYGGAAGFSAVYMLVYLVGKILILSIRSKVLGQIRDDVISQTFNIFAIISVVVPWTLVGLHLINAIYTSREVKNLTFVVRGGGGKGGGGGETKSGKGSCLKRHRRAVWMLSMWCVMSGVQLLAASSIPVVVSILTDSFRSLALFSMAVTAMLCLIIVVAIVIHTCQVGSTHSKWLLFTVILLAVLGLLLAVAFAVYFLVLTNEGLDGNSISVYVFSLVPSLLLAGVAYFSDNFLLQEEEEEEEKAGEKEEEDASDAKEGEREGKKGGVDDKDEVKPRQNMVELFSINNADEER